MTLKALDVLVFLSLSVDIDLLFTIDLYEDYADMYSLRISVPKAVMNEYLQDNNWTKERISEVIRIIFGHQEVDDMLNRIVKFERDIEKKLRSVSRAPVYRCNSDQTHCAIHAQSTVLQVDNRHQQGVAQIKSHLFQHRNTHRRHSLR